MKTFLVDKYIVLFGCLAFSIIYSSITPYVVIAFLCILILDSLAFYFDHKKLNQILFAIAILLVLVFPSFRYYIGYLLYIPLWMYHNNAYLKQITSIHQLRDDSTGMKMELESKNKEIIAHQNDKIQMATLNERNRISREIHDNVGHMLSRSILQVGALIATEKEPERKEQLNLLNDSLSSALTSIRESVHNLRDDSVNLYTSAKEIIAAFPHYKIDFQYDMTSTLPIDYRYSFISIIKESVSNVAKHSDATEISIILRQHPAFIQLVIRDNGTQCDSNYSEKHGMGLESIQKRVDSMNGTFRTSTDNGFQIFISVPYKESEVLS